MGKPPRHPGNRPAKSRFSPEVRVLYEDDAVVILDKPPGLPAVPIPGSRIASAWSLLDEALRLKRQRCFVVHRIDRFTSGVILFAKTGQDRDKLIRQFLAHTPGRRYLAVVHGDVTPLEATLVHYFRRVGMVQKLRPETDPEAARAELRYTVERPLRAASLVRVELVTGLQNQIRAQFTAIGHPVIGDRKYRGEGSSDLLIDRPALHATYLQFVHPRTGKSLATDSEPPRDFQNLVQRLSPRK